MPLFERRCLSCSRCYTVLKTFSTSPDKDECPHCASTAFEAVIGGFRHKDPDDISGIDPLEIEEIREAKAHYESDEFSRAILDGSAKIHERGPKCLRPKCPEHLLKKYY